MPWRAASTAASPTEAPMRGDRLLLKILGVAVAYWATARLGLLLAVSPGYACAIWPPAGVALAALLIGGRHDPPIVIDVPR